MQHNYLKTSVLLSVILLSLSLSSAAQVRTSVAPKSISPEDIRELAAIWKDVDPKLYRLQFNGGKEVYGTRKVTMDELRQVRKFTNPIDEKGWVVFAHRDEGIVLVFAASTKTKGSGDLTSVLGREKVAKLKEIIAKYTVVETSVRQ